ncbi:hypothetical protein CDD81_7777 [Ophiocordyceps australis]|uniref:Crossover junction endonuclease MUS81 n=1 Tax=Ophiocordyceps australis TaxID=1399860 RepID=A0A2C5X8V9_9HYPO|nr:hypothetical protein CDD81_7777 [Ophiocordyceps australis]
MADVDNNNCKNSQLLSWVQEWLQVARERNSKGVTVYKTAYESLKACPVAFEHPAQLQQLRGFGPKLCERLTDKLKEHCQQNGLPMPRHPQARRTALDQAHQPHVDAPPSRPKVKARLYVPTFRSGAYALIIALSTLPEDTSSAMTKADLIRTAQPHCDASFSAPSDPTKFYTAWNSIKTLLQKELVYERGRPLRKYALTDEGWDVAKRIKATRQWQSNSHNEQSSRADKIQQPIGQEPPRPAPVVRSPSPHAQVLQEEPSPYHGVVADGPVVTGNASLPDFCPIKLPPGSFSVHLVLDVREVRAKTDRDYMQDELAKQGAKPIMRSLELGDAQWIAKCNDPNLLSAQGAEGDEVVLDWIVERKRLDDLIGSIKDGRFHEQKFRLSRSGVQKVIYIIEEIAMDTTVYQRYDEAVQSAIASTQVVNGYFVKRTSKMDETIKYLSRLTKMLKHDYECKTLNVIPTQVLTAQNYLALVQHLRQSDASTRYYISYPAFASLASKSDMMTLRDVYLKMLMTTRGVTGERAIAIQKKWKTPYEFIKAFDACGLGEQGKKRKRELVFCELSHMVGRNKISKPLSHKIAEIWGDG